MAKWYEFSQHNTGGSFDHDPERGIGYSVWVEAESYEEANERAESIGLYFDGCDAGIDCDCCGDRWYRKGSYSSGDPVPTRYGKTFEPADDKSPSVEWGILSYAHPINGPFWAAKESK